MVLDAVLDAWVRISVLVVVVVVLVGRHSHG